MIAKFVYILCGLTSILCAGLLFRRFYATQSALLFWSTCCFGCLALTNVMLFIDLVLIPAVDLSPVRGAVALVGVVMLLYGLIREHS